ncbi:MAG: RagB/SusD family nutrient uptake outer membrane protein [Prevotellaceae bacterium]|nr:RagB/SusD family nutrient uptake outer membrane protein [Prevotellaceae bacterium]
MKRKNILILLCSVAFIAASCSLDYDPLDTYSDVTEGIATDSVRVVFKDKAAILSYRTTIHDKYRNRQEHWYLDMLLLNESHSDNAYAGSPNSETTPFEVNSIEGSNSNLYRDWQRYMEDVGVVNLLINNIDACPDPALTAAERAQYKAEALIFRSMIYFDMARIWGNVPLITTTAGDITSENVAEVYDSYFPPQTSELEVYQQIEQDLLEALNDAPDNDPNDKTQFSKTVARTLLAKIYAEKPLRDYDKVIQYCDAVGADGIDLENDFSTLFGVVLEDPSKPVGQDNKAIAPITRNSKEVIYEAQYFTGSGNWLVWMLGRPLEDWTFYFTWAKWITPSRDLLKAFQDEGDTKRLNETVVWYDCEWSIYYPANNYPFAYKYRCAYSNMIKYRYADLLLLKAEALIMKDNPDFAGAATIINRIRQRAGLSNLPSSATAGKESALNTLLKERRLELALEGERWFDLVRLDKVEEVMNAVYAKDSGRPAQQYPFTQNSYKLPIPQVVIDQNPNLVQNPGY